MLFLLVDSNLWSMLQIALIKCSIFELALDRREQMIGQEKKKKKKRGRELETRWCTDQPPKKMPGEKAGEEGEKEDEDEEGEEEDM